MQPQPLYKKQSQRAELAALPPRLRDIFSGLAKAGAGSCALFGGAARDADLAALWGEPREIKDYDLRCWLSSEAMKDPAWEARFGASLLAAFPGAELEMEPSLGTGRLRHIIRWEGIELDISVRSAPSGKSSPADCARDRALDSDASLSAVAIASDLSVWCESLYLIDRIEKRITFYSGIDPDRLKSYSKRMISKFPQAQPAFLGNSDDAPTASSVSRPKGSI